MMKLSLVEINPFYHNVRIDDSWATVSQETDPLLWCTLTNENACFEENLETNSDEEIKGNSAVHEKEFYKSSVPFPTVLQNIDGPDISVVNIAPAEGQLPVSFTSEPNWEALAFPKEYSTGKGHFNDNHEIPITPSKYIHACLKSSDDQWASNPQYIFHALDWIQKNTVASPIYFSQRKHYQADLNAGQVNSNNVRRTIMTKYIHLLRT